MVPAPSSSKENMEDPQEGVFFVAFSAENDRV